MLSCMVRNLSKSDKIRTLTNRFLTATVNMNKMINVRWAFNASAWKPTADEILACSSYIQPEEKERISKYVFQDDAKSSLIGRLLLRKFVHIATSIPYDEIKLGRDERGKPILLGVGETPISFNVSHQGDYVVLAGNTEHQIGIDIMKIEPPANKNIPEFFRIMNRQFSPLEWNTIKSFQTELEQIACFYRLWCLKESYVKNIGVGLTIPLHLISFSLKSIKLEVGEFATNTTLYEKNERKTEWLFEETLLDPKHAAAVSLKMDKTQYKPIPYEFFSFDELVKEAHPLVAADPSFRDAFLKKETKQF